MYGCKVILYVTHNSKGFTLEHKAPFYKLTAIQAASDMNVGVNPVEHLKLLVVHFSKAGIYALDESSPFCNPSVSEM